MNPHTTRRHPLVSTLIVLMALYACDKQADSDPKPVTPETVKVPPKNTAAPAAVSKPGKTVPEPNSTQEQCERRLATCEKAAKLVKSTLQDATDYAKELTQVKAQLKKDLEAARKGASEAKARLAKLSETPAAVYQDLVALQSGVKTSIDVDAVIGAVEKFRTRFPAAPENKGLKKLLRKLKKTRRSLKKSEDKAKALESLEKIKALLTTVEDGTKLPLIAIVGLTAYLNTNNVKYGVISKLPRANRGEAMKDPASERGRSMVVSGRVIQIGKDGEYYKGLICGDEWCNEIYYFVTLGTTRGIVSKAKAKFAGVLVQRYSYSNSGGGQTHSLLLVGYFKGQK